MRKLVVGISHGDVNGISYEIIIKALSDPRICELCTPVIFGNLEILNKYRKLLNSNKFIFQSVQDLSILNEQKVNFYNCIKYNEDLNIGNSTKEAGISAVESLQISVDELQKGNIDVLVTAPINKENTHSETFTFSGHTEFLQDKANLNKSLMFMVSERIKVGLVCNHVPIGSVTDNITYNQILERLDLMIHSLKYDFGIQKPKIAVLSLNPHAGDGGLLGDEENKIIVPLIENKQNTGDLVYGPFASDGFFGSNAYMKYDAVLAMYHDQGLIPFKMLASDNGVNFTAGLPFVRTSPSHGTAYNIAGENKASEESFRNAIYTAIDIFKTRVNYNDAHKDPLKTSENSHSRNKGKRSQIE